MKYSVIILLLVSAFSQAEPVKISVGIKLIKYEAPPALSEIVSEGHCEDRDFENQPLTCTHIPE